VLEDKECTGENITQCLSELLQRPERIQAMRDAALDLAHPDATDVLVSEILALATPA
jgi:UDP-N-acetylglucosamine:LPS N-acetylglucosamine transferase